MRLIKQFPLDAPSIVRMDSVIKNIGTILEGVFDHPVLRPDFKNNLAKGIEIFMYTTLDVDGSLLQEDESIALANHVRVDWASYVEQAQTSLKPLLVHAISRGVPKERIIEYAIEAFIERLLIAYPTYMPILLEKLL